MKKCKVFKVTKKTRRDNFYICRNCDCIVGINNEIAHLDVIDANIFKKALSKMSFSRKGSQHYLQRLGAYNKEGDLIAPYISEGE